MQYKYTATNTEGKKLTGVINAPTEEAARSQLNNLGFSILELKELAQNETEQTNMEKFEFEAFDKNGKKIKGTIPAKNALLSYKRLAEEYNFNIIYLAPINANPEEKERMRTSGLQEIKNQYEIGSKQNKQDENMQSIAESPEFLKEKKILIDQIDNILQKIENLMASFKGKISPEKKTIIEGYMDKLLRIKSSNNLDYIANTCKEMLEKIQEEAMFLENQQHDKERESIMLESQKMMMDLSNAVSSKKDVGTELKEGIHKIELKLKNSKFKFLLKPLKGIQSWFDVPPEFAQIKTQLKSLRSQKWDAFKIALKSPSEARAAAWENLKTIKAQERELKKKLKASKQLRHEKNLLIKREKDIYFIEEITTFTGWLLFFYLTYYFIGHYVTLKELSLDPFLGIPFDLKYSVLFKYLLAIIFIIHASTSLKLNFFLRSKIASILLITTASVLSLITVFNF